jgi:hypothetical protein
MEQVQALARLYPLSAGDKTIDFTGFRLALGVFNMSHCQSGELENSLNAQMSRIVAPLVHSQWIKSS